MVIVSKVYASKLNVVVNEFDAFPIKALASLDLASGQLLPRSTTSRQIPAIKAEKSLVWFFRIGHIFLKLSMAL